MHSLIGGDGDLKPKQIVNKSLKKKTFQGKRKYLCCFESGEKQMHEKR